MFVKFSFFSDSPQVRYLVTGSESGSESESQSQSQSESESETTDLRSLLPIKQPLLPQTILGRSLRPLNGPPYQPQLMREEVLSASKVNPQSTNNNNTEGGLFCF